MALFDDIAIDTQMAINELNREIDVRESVYPRWIAERKLDQATATHRIACLAFAVGFLTEMKTHETQHEVSKDVDH